ncbi:uncharacterized protein UTRI_05804 [Ustilago trichophora]|uniref:Uncharacterized protein n=1 Tax=Ustilago trichophora TaxID=86804 RepID=A0A5C3EJR0_9BASI|nr:uncharacterized protein UTRI_05804 [Ustilago trichophora]
MCVQRAKGYTTNGAPCKKTPKKALRRKGNRDHKKGPTGELSHTIDALLIAAYVRRGPCRPITTTLQTFRLGLDDGVDPSPSKFSAKGLRIWESILRSSQQ